MPPFVMPCATRKRSSVCTNISKIALPIPRTSYFAEVIYQSCYGNCEGGENPLKVGLIRVQRPITIDPAPASDGVVQTLDDPFLPHRIRWHARLAAIGIRS